MKKDSFILRMQQVISGMYLCLMTGVFPLCVQNGYFNILETKMSFFYVTTLILTAMQCVLAVIGMAANGRTPLDFKKNLGKADLCCLIFIIALLLSMALCVSPKEAFWGSRGHYFGVAALLLCAALYFVFSNTFSLHPVILWCMLAGNAVVCLLAALNHLGIDPLMFYMGLPHEKQYISTIGNINYFSGHLCLVVSVVCGLFLAARERFSQVVYLLFLAIAFMACLANNSDSVLLWMGILFLVLLWWGLSEADCFRKYLILLITCQASFALFRVFRRIFAGRGMKMGRLQKLVSSPAVVLSHLLIAAVFLALQKKWGAWSPARMQKIRKAVFWALAGMLFLAILFLLGLNLGILPVKVGKFKKYLLFQDNWGTYRGFLWRETWKRFREMDLRRKLFGYGIAMFEAFLGDAVQAKAAANYATVYAEAHNEFLQLLATGGVAVVGGYYGMVISSLSAGIRKAKENKSCRALVAAVIAYLGWGLVNSPLVFTVPYMFIIMGILNKHNFS